MRRWTSCRALSAAALLAAALLVCAATAALALPPPGAVALRVNGEAFTESDVLRVLKTEPGLTRDQALDRLTEEALIVQEAKRRKIDQTLAYRRQVDRWLQETAVGLIGVDTLRRTLAKAGGAQPSFNEFFPRWEQAYKALSKPDAEAVDAEVAARLDALKSAVSAVMDTEALRKYAVVAELPPEVSAKVEAARTTFGAITLEELLEEEPKILGHVTQTEDEVLKMWQQLAREIAGRRHLVLTAQKAGYFSAPGIKEQEALARREALRTVYLEREFAKRATTEAQLARIGREIPAWTTAHFLAVERAVVRDGGRVEADAAARAWRDSGTAPGGGKPEVLSMIVAWDRLAPDLKQIIIDQPWGAFLPPIRTAEGFEILHLMSASPPQGVKTLREMVLPLMATDVYRSLIEQLKKTARITRG